MAIVKNPSESHYLSRKKSPVIYRGGSSGLLYGRNCRKPANYRYDKQQAHRKLFGTAKILWDSLSPP